jgi:hypothetical protein
MARKTSSSRPTRPDLGVDYALIAIAGGAAIVALIYLLLI